MGEKQLTKMDVAELFWEVDDGGRDFHSAKYNHASIEGYELTYWEPFFPHNVIQDAYGSE